MRIFGSIFLLLNLFLTACAADRGEITVISREEGSGTRSAFVSLTGVQEAGEDKTYIRAEVSSSTAVVLQTVMGDRNAIGYLSVGALNDSVKALRLDGAVPTAEAIAEGSYPLARSFYLVQGERLSPAGEDFLRFVRSGLGQSVVQEEGYVPLEGGSFESSRPRGRLAIAGSGSVAPLMEALAEAYGRHNPDLEIEIQLSDSSTGLSALSVGLCELAMSSRELTEKELARGLQENVLCRDGIAVIVNGQNPVEELTVEELRAIFTGQLRLWSQVAP